VLELEAHTLEENQILENIQQHIERNGRYFNYQISDDPIEPVLEQESGD